MAESVVAAAKVAGVNWATLGVAIVAVVLAALPHFEKFGGWVVRWWRGRNAGGGETAPVNLGALATE